MSNDPVTVREWQLLVKAIDELKDMVESKLDGLHTDISSQKNKLITLEGNHVALSTQIAEMKDRRRWGWEKVIWPIVFILFAFLLPHVQWRP